MHLLRIGQLALQLRHLLLECRRCAGALLHGLDADGRRDLRILVRNHRLRPSDACSAATLRHLETGHLAGHARPLGGRLLQILVLRRKLPGAVSPTSVAIQSYPLHVGPERCAAPLAGRVCVARGSQPTLQIGNARGLPLGEGQQLRGRQAA